MNKIKFILGTIWVTLGAYCFFIFFNIIGSFNPLMTTQTRIIVLIVLFTFGLYLADKIIGQGINMLIKSFKEVI